MKNSHFFAYMARMKLIRRWSLMRNTREENDQEHSLQVAMIAHALAVLSNTRYGGQVDEARVALLAVYHEAPEIITGDLPTPIKYFNADMRTAYKKLEHMAAGQLLSYLPEDMRASYAPLLFQNENAPEWRFVKAADSISAYVKCVEEMGYGNGEFDRAAESIRKKIADMHMPEADDFMRQFVPSFALPLDALN